MKMYPVGKIGLSFLRRFDFAISATSFFSQQKELYCFLTSQLRYKAYFIMAGKAL